MIAPKFPPFVETMLATPGIYVLHDPKHPDKMVPIFSNNGCLFAMQVEQELDPYGFYADLTLEGPIKCYAHRTKDS